MPPVDKNRPPLKSASTTSSPSSKESKTSSSSMSFYQRILPASTCVGFSSSRGKHIFRSALNHNGLKSFYNLIQQYHTQTEPAFCGISTLVMVLNALAVDPHQHWKGPWRWYEERMLNCCLDLDDVKETGITLKDFQCLALCQGLSVDLEYVYNSDEQQGGDDGGDPNNHKKLKSSLDDFRRAVQTACVESSSSAAPPLPGNIDTDDGNNDDEDPLSVLVVSYNRKTLKQTGSGHFSPIAAYDPVSDSVLILDTARFKYGAHWVKLPLIYDAMKSIDPSSCKPRGYALLSFTPPATVNSAATTTATTATTTSTNSKSEDWMSTNTGRRTRMEVTSSQSQPVSILFRIKMNQNEKRRRYKQFLETKQSTISYDDVLFYFQTKQKHHSVNENEKIKEEEDPLLVWEIIEPVRAIDEVGKTMVAQMRRLIGDLMKNGDDETTDVSSSPSMNDVARTVEREESNQVSSNCCGKTGLNNKDCVSPNEAVYLTYLAALPESERRGIVMSVESNVPDEIREQLLMEADRIDSAIQMSDELTSFESP